MAYDYKYKYRMPGYLTNPTDRYDVATNMAHFLMAQGLGIYDGWEGYMRAADQRKIFGFKLGKGRICIDGENDTAACIVSTCFGMDRERSVWLDCKSGLIGRNFFSVRGDTPHEVEIEAVKKWFRKP